MFYYHNLNSYRKLIGHDEDRRPFNFAVTVINKGKEKREEKKVVRRRLFLRARGNYDVERIEDLFFTFFFIA